MEINVNDLVETVDDLRFCECNHSDPDPLEYSEEYRNGFNEACSKVVEILYSLSTAPVEVPEYVAEWFEKSKNHLEINLSTLITSIRTKVINNRELTDFEMWANNVENRPFETLIKMKDGYIVAKEPLYYVLLPDTSDIFIYNFLSATGDIRFTEQLDQVDQLTEKAIRAIDERYMAFAVPVEEIGK